jgi:hypothetical protein
MDTETTANAALPTPAKNRRPKWLWLAILGMVSLVVCVGMVVCVGLGLSLASGFGTEQEAVTQVIDKFMQTMVRKDVDGAAAYFMEQLPKAEIRAGLKDMLSGANFALIDGYQEIEPQDWNIGFQAGEPSGLVAHVSGAVIYAGDYLGDFEAVLVKENGAWKIYGININALPDKLEEYLKQNPF